MRKIFLVVLSTMVGAAQADPSNPCHAPASSTKIVYTELSSNAASFECAPKPIGSGSSLNLRTNNAGALAWWYCPAPDRTWHLNWAAGTNAFLSGKTLWSDLRRVFAAHQPLREFRKLTAKSISLPLSDPTLTKVWCPYAADMLTGAPADPPS